jgi:solute carrier family 25 carnitine/acylcarnitine transporter 20/29
VKQQESLSYFTRIMTERLSGVLNSTNATTVFLPVDSAWDVLHPIERLYLESDFAHNDLNKILDLHTVVRDGVKWSDTLGSGQKCEFTLCASDAYADCTSVTTVDGQKLKVDINGDKTTIAGAALVEPDVYASNGVLHTVDALLLPPGALQLTPEKFLLTLNCTAFVGLLHSVGLEALVNDTGAQVTILAPRDDVISVYSEGDDLPAPGSDALRRMLQYHFLPGRWVPSTLKDGMLVETALEEPGLGGDKQVLDVEVARKSESDLRIRFGGAGVVGDPGQ